MTPLYNYNAHQVELEKMMKLSSMLQVLESILNVVFPALKRFSIQESPKK